MAKKHEEKEEKVEKETLREIIEDGEKEETETPEVEEETKQEEPVETDKPDEPDEPVETKKPAEPEVPVEEVAEDIKTEVQEDYKKKVLEAIGITSKDEKEAKKEGYQSPWEKRGDEKPATWREALEAGAELAEYKRQVKEKEVQEAKEKSEKETKEAQEAFNAKQNQVWDGQLADLREKGRIPKVDAKVQEKITKNETLTDEDRKDPGLVAQRNLFETMYKVSVERQKEGKAQVNDLIHVYHEYFQTKKPAGATAPVSGGKPGVSTGKDDMSYEEMHNTPIHKIVTRP